jgi:hypothetical protein
MLLCGIGVAQDKVQATKGEVPAVAKKDEKKELPKVVSFTEIQKLKAENLQLKLVNLDKQKKELETEFIEILKGVFKSNGIDESDWGSYQFDTQRFVFNRVEKKPEEKVEKK